MALSIICIFVFQGLIFLGMVFMLRHFMKGNVRGELSHLDKLNSELMKREAELKQKIALADAEYATKMAQLEKELLARQSQAKQEANKVLEEGRVQALKEREHIIGEAIGTRDKVRSEIMAEMEGVAIEYSRQIMAQFFSEDLKKLLHNYLIDQLVEGIQSVNTERFQIQSDTAEIKVAESLSSEAKNKILQALKSKIHRDVIFNETVDPNLIGGVLLQFGSFVIDGTMLNHLKEASVKLKIETKRKYQGVTQ